MRRVSRSGSIAPRECKKDGTRARFHFHSMSASEQIAGGVVLSLTPGFSRVKTGTEAGNGFNRFWLPSDAKPLKQLCFTLIAHTGLKPGMCLAPKARPHTSLGQRPREGRRLEAPALEARFKRKCGRTLTEAMERAFSPGSVRRAGSWGVAPGWNRAVPLALKPTQSLVRIGVGRTPSSVSTPHSPKPA